MPSFDHSVVAAHFYSPHTLFVQAAAFALLWNPNAEGSVTNIGCTYNTTCGACGVSTSAKLARSSKAQPCHYKRQNVITRRATIEERWEEVVGLVGIETPESEITRKHGVLSLLPKMRTNYCIPCDKIWG